MGQKLAGLCRLRKGAWVAVQHNVAKDYVKSSTVAKMGDRGHNRHGPKRWRLLMCRPVSRRAGNPSNTMWPVPRFFQPFGHKINMGQKLGGGGCALCSGGSCVPIEHKVAWAEAYLHTKCHLTPSSRLATTDIGQKLGDCVPLGEGKSVPI